MNNIGGWVEMLRNNIELEGGWIITSYISRDLVWHGIIHKKCELLLNELDIRMIYSKGFVCAKCYEVVPDEVIGFQKLCNWRQ